MLCLFPLVPLIAGILFGVSWFGGSGGSDGSGDTPSGFFATIRAYFSSAVEVVLAVTVAAVAIFAIFAFSGGWKYLAEMQRRGLELIEKTIKEFASGKWEKGLGDAVKVATLGAL